jgi:ferredoxin
MGLHWFKRLRQEWVIPEIIPERCVHSLCEVAACTRCVDACPRHAWILDDASLRIDTKLCDGCGLCISACPEAALLPGMKQTCQQPLSPEPDETRINRRQFFRKALALGVETVDDISQPTPDAAASHPKSASPLPEQTLYPFVPTLDVTACNGCDVCVQLCPHQAIRLQISGDGQTAYTLHPEHCTGCDVCENACDQQAIQIQHQQTLQQASTPLTAARCKACGSPFHYPTTEGTERQYCRICAKTNHHRQLFQVH